MAFDARKFVRDTEPPSYIDLDGITHKGRPLSLPAGARLINRLREFASREDAEVGDALTAVEGMVREACSAMGFSAEATEKLLDLPMDATIEALKDFLRSSRTRFALASEGPASTNGSTSPSPDVKPPTEPAAA